MMPRETVRAFGEKEITIKVDDEEFVFKVPEGFVVLKDYILDKKILDMEDTEVEVVYDIKMVIKKNKLSVMDVDPPAYARLRRTGLNSVASIFHKGHDMSEDILIPWFYDTSVEALLRCYIAVLKKRAGGKPDVS